MAIIRSLVLVFSFSGLAVAGASQLASSHATTPATATATDTCETAGVPDPEENSCAAEGDECLTNGAPGCCRGLRCVGSVCKQ